jgi:hypothetical protein
MMLAGAASLAHAGDATEWVTVAGAPDVLIRDHSAERSGEVVTFWHKVVADPSSLVSFATARVAIDCKTKSWRLLAGATYFRDGTYLPTETTGWALVIPETRVAAEYEALCNKALF